MTAMTAGSSRVRMSRSRVARGVLGGAVLALCAAGIATGAATTGVHSAVDALLLAVRLLPPVAATVVALMILWASPVTFFRAYLSLGVVLFTASAAAGDISTLLPAPLLWLAHLAVILPIWGFLPVGYFFPTGRAVPRWSAWLVLGWAVLGLFALAFPWDPFPGVALFVLAVAGTGLILSVLGCQIVRFRRAGSATERQQLKWVLLALCVIAANIFAIMLVPAGSIGRDPLLSVIFGITGAISSTALPVAIGFAMLHYRLFEVDLVIGRGIVYTAAAVFVAAAYLVIVGIVGLVWPSGTPLVLPVAATAVAAFGLAPVHRLARRRVNRWLYGHRDDPATILSGLARELGRTADLDSTLARICTSVATALRLDAVEVRAEGADGTVSAHVGDPPDERAAVIALRFEGRRIGALVLWPRNGERLAARDTRMLQDVADAAGIAVHAALVTRTLQRSRESLITAREDERAALQRELHDGLGPTLASVAQRLGRARALIGPNPDSAASILASAHEGVGQAMAEVRAIVAGLRPPALGNLGLITALRSTWAGVEQPLVEIEGCTDALPDAVETAAYRIAMEAIGNAVQHGRARRCLVHVQQHGRMLEIRVQDDGIGGAEATRTGNGLRIMRERAGELGGSVTVRDLRPGTIVDVRIPSGPAG